MTYRLRESVNIAMSITRLSLVLLLCLALGTSFSAAQDDTEAITVPDIIGLPLPEAAATLNSAGLRLGTQMALGWTEDAGLPQNTISEQSIAPNETVTFGTSVDVTILRENNVRLLYDDNDITLINEGGGNINVSAITFNAIEGTEASFGGSQWNTILESADCAQLWSVNTRAAKDVPGCTGSTVWRSTNNPGAHFWTATSGAVRFVVLQDGMQRATCEAAPVGLNPDTPFECAFFLADSGGGDTTNYVYLAYTTNRWVILNNSPSTWMPLDDVRFSNSETNPGGSIADTPFDNPETIIGDVTRLAPNQCIFVRTIEAEDAPPQPCDVIATATITPEQVTWNAALFIQSSVGNDFDCPPATADRLTVCIMPR